MADIRPKDHDSRMIVARDWARWFIGDPSWADQIVAAYLNPVAAAEQLQDEMEDPRG